MKRQLRRDLLASALAARGFKEISTGRKYRDFQHPESGMVFRIGKNGALRGGQKRSQTRSYTDTTLYNKLLEEGRALAAK